MTEIQTSMLFIESWKDKIENPFLRSGAHDGYESQNFEYARSNVKVTDARTTKDGFSLDKNGFVFAKESQAAAPEILSKLRLKDNETIEKFYYNCVERLIKDITGASRVIIFDSTVRQRIKELAGTSPTGKEQPAFSVIFLLPTWHEVIADQLTGSCRPVCIQLLILWLCHN